jgi:hypothetical protein
MTGHWGSFEFKLWQDSGQPMPYALHVRTSERKFCLSFSSVSRILAAHSAVAAISADLTSLKAWESTCWYLTRSEKSMRVTSNSKKVVVTKEFVGTKGAASLFLHVGAPEPRPYGIDHVTCTPCITSEWVGRAVHRVHHVSMKLHHISPL